MQISCTNSGLFCNVRDIRTEWSPHIVHNSSIESNDQKKTFAIDLSSKYQLSSDTSTDSVLNMVRWGLYFYLKYYCIILHLEPTGSFWWTRK